MAVKLPPTNCVVDWDILIPLGPPLAFHVGCVVGDSIYVHGGISTKGSNSPCNKLHKLNLDTLIWTTVDCKDCPALSHHASLVFQDRYIMLVGGWNGKSRSSKIHVYDTVSNVWRSPSVSGFPDDGGLSSHTINELADGKILVIGRDGSLRMQRRHGNAYILSGTPESSYKYSEFSNSVVSRSGHTTSILGNKIFIIGGRSDKLVDVYSGYSSKHEITSSLLSKLVSNSEKLKPLEKFPCGRKHHVSLPIKGGLFVYGGETFDGRSREPVGDMFLMTIKPVGNFYKLGTSSVGRSGHVCVVCKDRVLIHGGITGKSGNVRSETFELKSNF